MQWVIECWSLELFCFRFLLQGKKWNLVWAKRQFVDCLTRWVFIFSYDRESFRVVIPNHTRGLVRQRAGWLLAVADNFNYTAEKRSTQRGLPQIIKSCKYRPKVCNKINPGQSVARPRVMCHTQTGATANHFLALNLHAPEQGGLLTVLEVFDLNRREKENTEH